MPLAHEAIDEPGVLIIKSSEVNADNLQKNDARNVMVKYLIDERHDSTRFSLRLYSVNKGGKTPLDRHNYEHHVYVLNGEGVLKHKADTSTTQDAVKQGDAIFIPSNAIHQFINNEDGPLVFLCVKGNPRLYRENSELDSERVDENRGC